MIWHMVVPESDTRWLCGLALGTVFLVAGSFKLSDLTRFRDTLSAMEVLPRLIVRLVWWSLPLLEAAVGLCVVVGLWLKVCTLVLVALLVCFIGVLAQYRLRGGRELVCGCFADFERRSATSELILRNCILLGAGFFVLTGRWSTVGRGLVDWLIAANVVAGMVLAWILLARLREVFTWMSAEVTDFEREP